MNIYELEPNEKNIKESLINDQLNNMEYLHCLINLFYNITNNQIICIDGDWGVGKTFLIKQLIYLIQNYKKGMENNPEFKLIEPVKETLSKVNENHMIFYYNAWENDDHKDSLESIIYSILQAYPKYKDKITNQYDMNKMLEDVINLITKIFSKKLLDVDLTAEKLKEIKTFEDLAAEINTFEEKKSLFKKLIDEILKENRMILIIDEVDRCNPNYATKVLEVIKHFYNLDNITTIIVTNNKELQCTIKQQFGESFDAYNYLNKIYDYIISIDTNKRSIEYSKKMLGFEGENGLIEDVFYAIINRYNFTLRECNRYRTLYDMVISDINNGKGGNRSLKQNEVFCTNYIIIPIILAFKIKDHDAYNGCLKGDAASLNDTIKYISDFYKGKPQEGFLEDYVDLDKTIEHTEEEIIESVVNIFKKNYNATFYNRWFLKVLKMTL